MKSSPEKGLFIDRSIGNSTCELVVELRSFLARTLFTSLANGCEITVLDGNFFRVKIGSGPFLPESNTFSSQKQ